MTPQPALPPCYDQRVIVKCKSPNVYFLLYAFERTLCLFCTIIIPSNAIPTIKHASGTLQGVLAVPNGRSDKLYCRFYKLGKITLSVRWDLSRPQTLKEQGQTSKEILRVVSSGPFLVGLFNYFIACTEKQPRKESLEKIEHGCRSADLVVRTVLLYDAFCKVVSLFLESRDDS